MTRHPLPHRPALLLGAALLLALAGCASRDQQRLNEAATSPLSDLNLLPVEWAEGIEFHVHKTYDIDIGEIDRVVSLLEGTDLMTDP